MSIATLIASFCTGIIFTIVTYYSFIEDEIENINNEYMKSNFSIKNLVVEQPRIAEIIKYSELVNLNWNEKEFYDYASEMNNAIKNDVTDGIFYEIIRPERQMKNINGLTIFRDKWIADVLPENFNIIQSFTRGVVLAMHAEKVMYPSCEPNQIPHIIWMKLYLEGHKPLPTEVKAESDGWRIIIDGSNDFSLDKLNQRLLVKRGCRENIATKSEKNNENESNINK